MRKSCCFLTAALLCGITSSLHAQATIEDFSSAIRKNAAGGDLVALYVDSAHAGQTASIENGMYKVSAGANEGWMWQFLPQPYVGRTGFLQGWLKSGSSKSDYNRLTLRMKCDKSVPRGYGGNSVSDHMNFGTYVKRTDDACTNCQGQHYYHGMNPNIYANRWMYITLNRKPQHRVGLPGSADVVDDPEWNAPTEYGPAHYYEGFTRFYFQDFSEAANGNVCYFDDLKLDYASGEPDFLVSSVTATYNGSAYELSWATRKNSNDWFDVRYSTSSMKVNGWQTGTAAGGVGGNETDYTSVLWTSPSMKESSTGMYFAIRPSKQALFTEVYVPAITQTPAANSCDLNGDGVVNGDDLTLLQKSVVGTQGCVADLDANGKCDVVDLQRVANAALGQPCRVGR